LGREERGEFSILGTAERERKGRITPIMVVDERRKGLA